MRRVLTVLSVPFIMAAILIGCGNAEVKGDPKSTKEPAVLTATTSKSESAQKEDVVPKKPLNDGSGVKPITNNPSVSPGPNAGYVTINPHSPYPDYCELFAKYMNQKFDTNTFKHMTIEDLQMYAKQTNPQYEYGEVIINVEHVKGKVSKYKEGKNKLYIRFELHSDGTKNFDSMDFNPIH